MPDPTLPELDTIRTNLAGVTRVFLSGGEPLLRRDFGDIVDMYTEEFTLGIPTNATRACGTRRGWPARSPSSTSAWKGRRRRSTTTPSTGSRVPVRAALGRAFGGGLVESCGSRADGFALGLGVRGACGHDGLRATREDA